MQCPNCEGRGYLVVMRPAAFGAPIEPPLTCTPCNGTGIVPDPKPVRFKSRLAEARRRPRP
jgi:DnaJ-class molecular chaperone